MDRWSSYPYYEQARPLEAECGIPARSRRGAIGETWWSRRFIELLESFGVGSRLKRGRSYARSGQVCELEVEAGIVLADVQGSRHTPYRVRIRARVLSEPQWRRAEKAMAGQALPLAKLLAGDMPYEIEDILGTCKLKLFPASGRELTATCTCPDWENPCKHIAAVYYILAERFDEDPFLIFAWRGRTQEELLERLRAVRARWLGDGAAPAGTARTDEPVDVDGDAAPPLAELIDAFWSSGPELAELRVSRSRGRLRTPCCAGSAPSRSRRRRDATSPSCSCPRTRGSRSSRSGGRWSSANLCPCVHRTGGVPVGVNRCTVRCVQTRREQRTQSALQHGPDTTTGRQQG